jgi:large subunit ribosomal protein L23
MNLRKLIDLVKYPIITDKATKLLELNQYTFANPPIKQRRIGKFIGNKPNYKKAVITLAPGNSINLFSEN